MLWRNKQISFCNAEIESGSLRLSEKPYELGEVRTYPELCVINSGIFPPQEFPYSHALPYLLPFLQQKKTRHFKSVPPQIFFFVEVSCVPIFPTHSECK